MDSEKLVALGCKLGLSGAELRKWVAQKEKNEKEKVEKAREEAERARQAARDEAEKAIQAAREEAERAEREREKDFERQHQLERERAGAHGDAQKLKLDCSSADRSMIGENRRPCLSTNLKKVKRDFGNAAADQRRTSGKPPLKCYSCNKFGHIAKDCWSNFNRSSASRRFKCGRSGHKAATCRSSNEERRQDLRKCASPRADDSEERQGAKKIHVVGAITAFGSKTVPVVEGKLSGKTIAVLRSTGTSTVIVGTDLVREEEFTGETNPVYFMDGSMRELPIAEIEVETPYFSGSVTALCMERSMYDLILGNIDGVRDLNDPITLTAHIEPPAVAVEKPLIEEACPIVSVGEAAAAAVSQDRNNSTEVVQNEFDRNDELEEENASEENTGRSTHPETTKEGQDSSGRETADVSAIRKEETAPELCENAPIQTSKDDDPTGDAELEDGDNIPVVDAVMTSRPNADDESEPDIAGRVNEENVVLSEDTSGSTVSVQEDPVREGHLTGQTSAVCVVDSSRSKATDSTVKVEVPVESRAALCGERSPYRSVGDDPVAVDEKPPNTAKEEPVLGAPRSDASDRGEDVLVIARTRAKTKLAHFWHQKSAAPPIQPHRRKRSAEEHRKNKSWKTDPTKLGKQRNCRKNERTVGLERKSKRVCRQCTHRPGVEKHRPVTARGKAREGQVVRRFDVRQTKAQELKRFRGPGITVGTKEFVASRDIWKGTSPKRRIQQAQLRKRPIDTG